ncbi:hypothetical protein NDU88_005726 [Pleurodeles waltl]|uniref:Uncharacterized protein n=1 Tax=Pleurodeles waltl TaxID=8319 RepID=A0AAV7QFV4_PLEWA|nr:hypothetical protein NDU88_005726 [Pleurodeles waltl]
MRCKTRWREVKRRVNDTCRVSAHSIHVLQNALKEYSTARGRRSRLTLFVSFRSLQQCVHSSLNRFPAEAKIDRTGEKERRTREERPRGNKESAWRRRGELMERGGVGEVGSLMTRNDRAWAGHTVNQNQRGGWGEEAASVEFRILVISEQGVIFLALLFFTEGKWPEEKKPLKPGSKLCRDADLGETKQHPKGPKLSSGSQNH